MDTLTFEGVSKSFGAMRALSSVTVSLPVSKIVGLIGDNGAGKTTFIRLAAGVLRPTEGEVRLLGKPADRNDRALMSHLGALIENPGHYEKLTVEENLRFAFGFYHQMCPRGTLDAVVREQLRKLGLDSIAATRVWRLSSGFRQRLAVARAVHPWVDVVLLDEPFLSLDPGIKSQIKTFLRDLKVAHKLVLFSSHTLADVEQLADGHTAADRGTSLSL